MDFVRMSEEAARLILDDRVVVPAVPMPEHYLHEFVRPIVAQVVLDHFLAAHVLRFTVIERGVVVPCREPVGHQIERGVQASHMERLALVCRYWFDVSEQYCRIS